MAGAHEVTRIHQERSDRVQVRRWLVDRTSDAHNRQATGTALNTTFDVGQVLQPMIGDVAEAMQFYVSRIAANDPEPHIAPLVSRSKVTATQDRNAAEQERLLSALWDTAGGRDQQWKIAWSQCLAGVGWYLTYPRDLGWGLPDRTYFDDASDEELERLRSEGLITEIERDGVMTYAERADIWQQRREEAMQQRAVDAKSLFVLEALPYEAVKARFDSDGVKEAWVIEEVPAISLGANGSEYARLAARRDNFDGDLERYGLTLDEQGRVIGGVDKGSGEATNGTWTLVRYFNRLEAVFIVCGNGMRGGKEVLRVRHGATDAGRAVCPAVPVAFYETDSFDPNGQYSTPMERVFALAPLINQLETHFSLAAVYNGEPRWVVELNGKDGGGVLRDSEGNPVIVEKGAAPGLSPADAVAYPGTLRQLTIDTTSIEAAITLYLEQLADAKPSPALSGGGSAAGPALTLRTMIREQSQTTSQAVSHHAGAVKSVFRMWTGWLRQLDTMVYAWSMPGGRSSERELRGYIEFDPADLTDSFVVLQDANTAADRVVIEQEGLELSAAGKIDDYEFHDKYRREPDAREAVVRQYVQGVVNHVTGAQPAPPGSIYQVVGDLAKGRVDLILAQRSPAYAIAQSLQMAQQARQQQGQLPPGVETGPGMEPPRPDGNVAFGQGLREPSLGAVTESPVANQPQYSTLGPVAVS